MKYNQFLFEQVCPRCGRNLLDYCTGTYNCPGPTIEEMHAALESNLKRMVIKELYENEG